MNEADLAYTAGIIDGEGYIGIIRLTKRSYKFGNPMYQMRVSITMCNPLIPSWLHTNFGGAYREFQPPSLKHKRLYTWRISCGKAMEFLKLVLPYLKMKEGEARIAIEFQAHRSTKYCKMRPKPLVIIEAEAILHKQLKELHERQYQPGNNSGVNRSS